MSNHTVINITVLHVLARQDGRKKERKRKTALLHTRVKLYLRTNIDSHIYIYVRMYAYIYTSIYKYSYRTRPSACMQENPLLYSRTTGLPSCQWFVNTTEGSLSREYRVLWKKIFFETWSSALVLKCRWKMQQMPFGNSWANSTISSITGNPKQTNAYIYQWHTRICMHSLMHAFAHIYTWQKVPGEGAEGRQLIFKFITYLLLILAVCGGGGWRGGCEDRSSWVIREKANTTAIRRRSSRQVIVLPQTRVSAWLLRTSCNVGKILNMWLDMSRSHGVKNIWNFRVCSGSQQFQKMSGTRFSMNTFRRQTLSTPTLCRQILQRLLKRRRLGTLAGALFLGWLTCLLNDLSLASVWTCGWASSADPWARLSRCFKRMLWLGQCARARAFLLICKAITSLLAKGTREPPEAVAPQNEVIFVPFWGAFYICIIYIPIIHNCVSKYEWIPPPLMAGAPKLKNLTTTTQGTPRRERWNSVYAGNAHTLQKLWCIYKRPSLWSYAV